MGNHETRLTGLERLLRSARVDPTQARRDAALDALLGDFLDDVLDAEGRLRPDLTDDERATAEEVIGLLELGEERARQSGEQGTPFTDDRQVWPRT